MKIRRMASLKTADALQQYLADIGVVLPFDDKVMSGPDAPLSQPYRLKSGFTVGNRFCILPMEGWDGTVDGHPTELVRRRWRRFGLSGAKLIWGGEAVAVRHDGRANPNQLMINEETLDDLAQLRRILIAEHELNFCSSDDLLLGLQLTHSGRFARPNEKTRLEPMICYHHPILDAKFGVSPEMPVLTDDEIDQLVTDFVRAAELAQQAGFAFVDIKHCHGYLGHELLSAVERPGQYGGSFENRTRFLRQVVAGIRARAPGLGIGVRLSAFDFVPFRSGPDGRGEPTPLDSADVSAYHVFGGDDTGLGIDLAEPYAFVDLLASLDIELLCISGGNPYSTPHALRPTLFPPSDGYQPPEDPLAGVARHIAVTAKLKAHCPELAVVGSAYSYLQEWLPHVAQHVIRTGKADFIGLGRMALSYPDLPADVLSGRALQRKRICRTFSDCTTAPRKGMVSGCFPLDEFYKERPEAAALKALKKQT